MRLTFRVLEFLFIAQLIATGATFQTDDDSDSSENDQRNDPDIFIDLQRKLQLGSIDAPPKYLKDDNRRKIDSIKSIESIESIGIDRNKKKIAFKFPNDPKADYNYRFQYETFNNGTSHGVMTNYGNSKAIVVQNLDVDDEITDFNALCAISKCGLLHPACGITMQFGPHCPSSAKLIKIDDYKDNILNVHNNKRNKYAGGYHSLKPAARMTEMQWSTELSKLASLNVMNCIYKKDKCHNTRRFPYSGQNTGRTTFHTKHIEIGHLIKRTFDAWIKHSRNLTMSTIYSYPSNSYHKQFTVIIKDQNSHVGCGGVIFKNKKQNTFLFTCNYAYNNIIGRPIYHVGKTAGSLCLTGRSSRYKNLCNVNEYNADTKLNDVQIKYQVKN